jgi:hypothetical protein
MDVRKRRQNERKFPECDEPPDGGRRYWFDVKGRTGWTARYVKHVDSEETTVRFHQEIFDETGTLREVHDKFPIDRGHHKMDRNGG